MSAALDLNEPPSPGGNAPPLPERLALDHEALLERIEKLAAAATELPPVIENDDQQTALGDLVKLISECLKDTESKRTAEKEPYLKAGREVDGFFKIHAERLDKMKARLTARATEYLRMKATEERRRREEEARKAREEQEARMRAAEAAERDAAEKAAALQAEASRQAYLDRVAAEKDRDRALDHAVLADKQAASAEKAAAAAPSEMARTRGAASLSTLKREWVCDLVDRSAITAELLPFLSDEAVEKAGRAAMRAGRRQLAGFRIYETETASIR